MSFSSSRKNWNKRESGNKKSSDSESMIRNHQVNSIVFSVFSKYKYFLNRWQGWHGSTSTLKSNMLNLMMFDGERHSYVWSIISSYVDPKMHMSLNDVFSVTSIQCKWQIGDDVSRTFFLSVQLSGFFCFIAKSLHLPVFSGLHQRGNDRFLVT